jgi:hypothetical protein
MPPRAALTSSFSVSDANNEVVCPLTNQDGSNCRKRCLGVSVRPLAPRMDTSVKGLRCKLKTADARLQYPGKALSFDAGAHPPSTSRLLHPETSSDRGEFPIDGQYPSVSPTTTSPRNRTEQKRAMYVGPPKTQSILAKNGSSGCKRARLLWRRH